MSFRDFLLVTRQELALPERRHPAALMEPDVADELLALAYEIDAYDLAWQDYLCCGGFPRAVTEHHRFGAVSRPYQRDLLAWLRADVDPDAALESLPQLRCRRRLDDGRALPKTQAKHYLTDPLLAWLPSTLSPGISTSVQ
ncbi:MAG: hypothetical protein FJ077_06580 [Cyanobacteria bacterium K_DeepCast_35m_m2_023]|nr:hypothetical protein [Cyanobacteria bacterium K_DeepCast_35m_m2_023]